MDRWACVSVPALPLQIVARNKPEWRALPTVVVSEDKPQGKVQWANAEALRAGVLTGQSYALALSLCVGLRACVVSECEVASVTQELKALLWRFSPALEVGAEAGVFWLDASGLGRLYASRFVLIKRAISVLSTARSFLGTQKHFMVSLPAPSGTPITAASCTEGCAAMTCSIWAGKTLRPFTMTMSFFRSRMNRKPSSSRMPMSPVLSQPSSVNSSLVASGLRW